MSEASLWDGPHQAVAASSGQERFLARFLDVLWRTYRQRVSHVADYERVVRQAGGRFVNDHIAFRTFAVQQRPSGISAVSRLFQAQGFVPAGSYEFADKHLSAVHFQHPNAEFPKLFVSELRVWELPHEARTAIARCTAEHRDWICDDVLAEIATSADPQRVDLLEQAVNWIHQLPWPAPEAEDVELVNAVSQYGAWVMVHGYNVNHFTSLVNSHGVASLDGIDKTVSALQAAGVPMKQEIEGAEGSKLRQTATAAAVIDVPVRRQGRLQSMPWTYAYFELAERGLVDGRRFEGFLGAQATQLFEMTRKAPE